MGQHHARIWATMPGARLVGIADPDMDRARAIAERYNVPTYTDHDELLKEVEAVSIAAPTTVHYPIAMDCLSHGVHMLIEKPLASTLREGTALVKASREAGVTLQVGHVERFNPTFAELGNVLSNHEILSLDARRLSPYAARAADVSVVYDLMVHDLDLILTTLGAAPADVQAVGSRARSPQLDHVVALLKFQSGQTASLSASKVTQHKVRELSVTCAEAFVVSDFLARTIMVYRASTADYLSQRDKVLYRQEGLIEQVYVPPVEPLYAELEHFFGCVRQGQTPRVSGEDALRVLAVADRIEAQALGVAEVSR
jgi:predicted dehydrogenase